MSDPVTPRRTYSTTTMVLAIVMYIRGWPLLRIEPNPNNREDRRNEKRFVMGVPDDVADPDAFAMRVRNDEELVPPFQYAFTTRFFKEQMREMAPDRETA